MERGTHGCFQQTRMVTNFFPAKISVHKKRKQMNRAMTAVLTHTWMIIWVMTKARSANIIGFSLKL